MPADLIVFADLAARSAVVLGLAGLAIFSLPRLSAAARYWVWLTAIAALPLLPLSTALVPGVPLIDVATAPEPSQAVAHRPTPDPPPAMDHPPTVPATAPRVPLASADLPVSANPALTVPTAPDIEPVSATSLFPFATAIYLAVITGLLIPLALGMLRLRRLRRTAYQMPPGDLQAVAGALLASRGHARIQILLSPAAEIPLTWGIRRQTILLPEVAAGWTRARSHAVLAHEIAHIDRRDFVTGLLASLLRTLFWFQPLAWYAHRRLAVEREIACDDRVLLAATSSPADYAEHLYEVVRDAGRCVAPAVAMARPSDIVGRVRAILDSARHRAPIGHRAKTQVALLSLALLSPLAFVRCTGEKPKTGASGDTHQTSIGLTLRPVDPAGITIDRDGQVFEIPAVSPFLIADREVTQGDFQEVMGQNPSSTKAVHLPVDQVTRSEAAAFCKALTARDRAAGVLPAGKVYRLPSLHEWLIACHPGGLSPEGEALDAIAWHRGNSAGLLHPVGAKMANAYGLHDMIGNAAEWVATDPDPQGHASAPASSHRGRVVVQLRDSSVLGPIDVQTQAEIIKTEAVLSTVAEKLKLAQRWEIEPAAAVAKLERGLTAKAVPSTNLIGIDYSSADPKEAMDIANAVAEIYRFHRMDEERQRADKALDILENQLAAQEDKLEASRVRLLNLMEKHKIVDLGPGQPAWLRDEPVTGIGAIVLDAKRKEFDAEGEIRNLRTTVKALQELSGDDLIKAAVNLGIKDSTLTHRYPDYQALLLNRTQLLESGVGPGHPKIVSVDKQIAQMKGMLEEAAETARGALGTQLAMAEQTFENSKAAKEKTEKESLRERRQNIEYVEARADYELHKEMLNNMEAQLAKERVDASSAAAPITIHKRTADPALPATGAGAGGHLAIGGAVSDRPEDLAIDPAAPGLIRPGGERISGVGFRFVMADE